LSRAAMFVSLNLSWAAPAWLNTLLRTKDHGTRCFAGSGSNHFLR
jgi:hypothetical protein